MPWSGRWWPTGAFPPPMAAAGGPLDKFDRYIASLGLPPPGASSWEAIHHYKPGCIWCGHCHGWAAAAILEPEPTSPVRVGMIDFTVGDLKGLLTEAHYTDAYDLIEGARDIVTGTGDDQLKAIVFHRVLLDWVMNGEPVIMDRTKKAEVRNHPVYRCQMTSRPDPSDPRKTHVTATLWFVSARVSPDYVGTRGFQMAYQYWITGDFQNPSDGNWEGSSQNDHPGLIWRPTYVNYDPRRNPNPAVKYYDPYILQLLNKISVSSFRFIYNQSFWRTFQDFGCDFKRAVALAFAKLRRSPLDCRLPVLALILQHLHSRCVQHLQWIRDVRNRRMDYI